MILSLILSEEATKYYPEAPTNCQMAVIQEFLVVR